MFTFKNLMRDAEKAQWIKALTRKSGNVSSIPRNPERWKKKRTNSTKLSSDLYTCTHTYTTYYTSLKIKNFKSNWGNLWVGWADIMEYRYCLRYITVCCT